MYVRKKLIWFILTSAQSVGYKMHNLCRKWHNIWGGSHLQRVGCRALKLGYVIDGSNNGMHSKFQHIPTMGGAATPLRIGVTFDFFGVLIGSGITFERLTIYLSSCVWLWNLGIILIGSIMVDSPNIETIGWKGKKLWSSKNMSFSNFFFQKFRSGITFERLAIY